MGENYLKYKHFLNPGTFVSVKGRIEVPPRCSELEFSIHSIDLLSNLKDQKANGLNLKVSMKSLDQIMITDLAKIFDQNVGTIPVRFTVYDPLDNVEVHLPSKSLKVDLTNELFNELQKFDLDIQIK